MEFENSKVKIDFLFGGGGGDGVVGSIIRDRNDFVSNRYSIAFHSYKLCSYSIKMAYVETTSAFETKLLYYNLKWGFYISVRPLN